MSVNLYDEALAEKIQSWIPEDQHLTILKPDQTAALFQMTLDKNYDQPIKLPLIALSRETQINILNTNKQVKTFDGVVIGKNEKQSITLNAIPIQINYQLDIYTRHMAEGCDYLREFVFKFVNDPTLQINIPYYDVNLPHKSNMRLSNTINDNSDVPQKLFNDQFTRFTIYFYIDDAYMFNTPIKTNKTIEAIDVYTQTSKNSVEFEGTLGVD